MRFKLCEPAKYVHFLCLPLCPLGYKKNEPAAKRRKKMQPITRRFTAGLRLPCAALKELTLRKVVPLWGLHRIVYTLFIPLLGCVKWQDKNMYILCFVC
jgi:hypothetical protein